MSEEEKDKKSKLAGWIALIGAIAALLTAIGFNQFFPGLVNRFLSSSPSPSLPAVGTSPSPSSQPPPSTPSSPSPPPSAAPPSSPAPAKIAAVEKDFFKFQLQECQRSGEDVQCSLLVTNLANGDREFALSGNYGSLSRGIDVSGNEYAATPYSQLGQAQGSPMYGFAKVKLIPDIPIKGNLYFTGIPQNVSKLALLEVGYIVYGPYADYRSVKFRDIDVVSK